MNDDELFLGNLDFWLIFNANLSNHLFAYLAVISDSLIFNLLQIQVKSFGWKCLAN